MWQRHTHVTGPAHLSDNNKAMTTCSSHIPSAASTCVHKLCHSNIVFFNTSLAKQLEHSCVHNSFTATHTTIIPLNSLAGRHQKADKASPTVRGLEPSHSQQRQSTKQQPMIPGPKPGQAATTQAQPHADGPGAAQAQGVLAARVFSSRRAVSRQQHPVVTRAWPQAVPTGDRGRAAAELSVSSSCPEAQFSSARCSLQQTPSPPMAQVVLSGRWTQPPEGVRQSGWLSATQPWQQFW